MHAPKNNSLSILDTIPEFVKMTNVNPQNQMTRSVPRVNSQPATQYNSKIPDISELGKGYLLCLKCIIHLHLNYV